MRHLFAALDAGDLASQIGRRKTQLERGIRIEHGRLGWVPESWAEGNPDQRPPLCANMTETLAPLLIRVEGQEGNSHGKDSE
jgi:hypothetical protein